MDIIFCNRTFKDLRDNKSLEVEDPYHIMSSLSEKMREAVLNNPSGYKDEDVCQILALDGNKVVGCVNPFKGRLLEYGNVLSVQNGSNLYAHELYRKENVGGELLLNLSALHPNKDNLYSGISNMAIGLYKVLQFTVFEYPRLIYLRKSRSVIHALLKTESSIVTPLIWIADVCLWLHRGLLRLETSLKTKGYSIELTETVPDEVEKIVLSDEHPYKELHDKRWFEWNLKYSFSKDPLNKKRLYIIKKDDIVEGFFLIKQEFFKQASSRGFKNVYLGSVMEWGLTKESKLTELLLYMMSIKCFDKNIDGIQVASDDNNVVKSLKKHLFVRIGMCNMGFKFKSVKDPKVKDINNWRIRIACGDTLID